MRKTFLYVFIVLMTVTFSFRTVRAKDLSHILKEVELIPVMVNGDKDNRINIVIMNRWTSADAEPYNKPEMRSEFIKHIKESMVSALTYGNDNAKTAYAHYKDYFNVYGLWWPTIPEWGKGVGQEEVDFLMEHYFLPWKDEHTGWVTVLVMPNSRAGGGGAARNLEARTGSALIAGNGVDKMLHEISHTCMSIGDEYTTMAKGINGRDIYNSSNEYERDIIKWRKWIDEDTPVPTPYTKKYLNKVGAFEGCQYHLTEYYRSTAQGCIMGSGLFDNTPEMCPICNQRVVTRINALVDIVKKKVPAKDQIEISGPTRMAFSVDHLKPRPDCQKVVWTLNGKVISEGKDKIDVSFGNLKQYEVRCTITDVSPFVRPDPPFASYPQRVVKWNVINTSSRADVKTLDLSVKAVPSKTTANTDLKVVVKGGSSPYTIEWSNGVTTAENKDLKSGIYDVRVVDAKYRSADFRYVLYDAQEPSGLLEDVKNTAFLGVSADAFASGQGRNNGRILLKAADGITFKWDDARNEFINPVIYEAEDAGVSSGGKMIKPFWTASNGRYVSFCSPEQSMTWKVTVAKSGIYPIELVYATVQEVTPDAMISSGVDSASVSFKRSLPLYIGWDDVCRTSLLLKKGENEITLSARGETLPNIDYIKVPSSYIAEPITASSRNNLKPGSYKVAAFNQKGGIQLLSVDIPEVYPFEVSGLKVEATADNGVRLLNAVPGYSYRWYADDVPVFKSDKVDTPLATGTLFYPKRPGNYYIAAKDDRSNAESKNRIGFAVGTDHPAAEIITPETFGVYSTLLWFDASDIDGDGYVDCPAPDRGPVKAWKENTWLNPAALTANYKPNVLNGKGVCGFDKVWVDKISKDVKGYQTIIMVYKESDVSVAGTSLFRGLNKYIGKAADSGKALFDYAAVDEKTRNGRVFLNGRQVDPFKTPNPLDYCILIVELESPADEVCNVTEGRWEADLAELVLLDRKMTDEERKGIEEYLRKKWFSEIDLEF